MAEVLSDNAAFTGTLAPVTTLSRRDAAVNEIRRAIVLEHVKQGERLTEVKWLNS